MNNRKRNLFCVLLLLFSFYSCSRFTNKGSGPFGNPDNELNAVLTTTPEMPVYQKFECIPSTEAPEIGFVVEVIDGDSIKAKIGDEVYEIRYIGINTPEYYSSEKADAERATLENKRLIEGKKIYLFKDKSNTDQYHRLLRYVFTNEYFVNFEMVKSGLAESKSYFPDTSCQVFLNQALQ